ncbi:hypothetical protein, partial [Bacteroides cellulosilyticus]|uniref:hypothetical protein n=1 Tax=Bacteroides cellulosilyticus TaxID=246787 RepID=UPI00321A4663
GRLFFNCEEKQYISKQKCKVNPGIVSHLAHNRKASNLIMQNKQCRDAEHCLFHTTTLLVVISR